MAEDGKRFVDTVAEISQAGRAPKNDPALFALALAVADKRREVSSYALSKLPVVARIPTHLFHFAEYVQSLRGWGRALRSGVADWYLSKPAEKLAYQLAKYQSRNGWTNANLLRLSHANPELQADHKELLHWAVKGWESVGDEAPQSKALLPIWVFEKAKRLTSQAGVKELVRLIAEYDLPRECVPTEFLSQVEVWDALLQKMPMTAMIRNLGKMTSIGLVSPNSEAAKMVGERLEDAELLHKARIHPISVLMAQSVYKTGHGIKGSLSWSPVPRVINALEKAFYASFANAPKTGKRFYIGLDVSGSMGSGNVAGTPLTPREAAAAMAMVTMKTEDEYYIAGFTNGSYRSLHSGSGYGSGVTKLELTPDMTLDAACRYTAGLPFGGTDCALPMIDALAKKIPADVFIVITDNETWAGEKHAATAGCDIKSSMDVVRIGQLKGIPVFCDKNAWEADHIAVVSRVKPHTDFDNEIESGLFKMMSIGLGKQEGSEYYHRAGHQYSYAEIFPAVGKEVLQTGKVLFGLAIVENGYGDTAKVEAILPKDFYEKERNLLRLAKLWLGRLPFDDLDLLIVDEMGKNISGTGMDSNVIGRPCIQKHRSCQKSVSYWPRSHSGI